MKIKKLFQLFLTVILSFAYLFNFSYNVSAVAVAVDSYTDTPNDVGSIYSSVWQYQSFTATQSYQADLVAFTANRTGTVGIMTISIRETPTGSDLVYATLAAGVITTGTPEEYTVEFNTSANLTTGTVYYIVYRISTGSYPDNLVKLSMVNPSGYDDGVRAYSSNSGTSWNVVSNTDIWFKILSGTAGAVPPTLSLMPYAPQFLGSQVIFTAIVDPNNNEVTETGVQLSLTATPSESFGSAGESFTDRNINDITAFSEYIDVNTLTAGNRYYYRFVAKNAYGWGYSIVTSFDYVISNINLTLTTATVRQGVTGNYTTTFHVIGSPPAYSTNVSAHLGKTIGVWENDNDLSKSLLQAGDWLFTTSGIGDNTFPLIPDTTYYYQGYATYNGTTFYSEIKSFTTNATAVLGLPIVTIVKVKDVSSYYQGQIAIEIIAKAQTTLTDKPFRQWFEMSTSATPDTILPPTKIYYADILNPDSTFSIIMFPALDFTDYSNLDNDFIYFRAYAQNNAGVGYSNIYNMQPTVATSPTTPVTPTTPTTIPKQTSDLVKNAKISLGLTGIMGSWAFMGLILLLIAFVFGIAYFVSDNYMGKTAIGVTWLLTSVSTVGAFLFTGELGIWTVVIAVIAVVAVILVFLSVKLSGSSGNIQ